MKPRRSALVTAALAAALACGPLATAQAAAPTTTPTTVRTATHAAAATAHPAPGGSVRPKQGDTKVPVLPSAPLKGLPTLREARKQGLLAGPVTAGGGATAQAFPGYDCTTPPQGWGYHDYLAPGECLTPDTYIAVNSEPGGWYELWMQSDGNLVLYFHGAPFYTAKWQTNTRASNATLWMQHDGNVVLYDGQGNPLWNTGTYGCGGLGAWLRVQTDTNLVLYTSDWTPIWARFKGPASRPC
ncbi:hypothetical protein ACH4TP_20580 [Streptomyces sp. NPDC021012]|uniref:hypothetical protein n=1 Tax=Streptomyces sp. NPDC021012 TaxID=3365107 RepID=UPI0037B364D3